MSKKTISPSVPQEDLEHVLTQTKPFWEQLRGGRIFVTGATGFFGAWLLESFCYINNHLGLEAELVALSRDPQVFQIKMPHLRNHPALQFHQGDVRDFLFPQGHFSHVIHAGTTSSAPVPREEMRSTIIEGTRHTLEFAVASGVERCLFVSSGAVYGEQVSGSAPLSESSSVNSNLEKDASAYAEGKRAAELLCREYYEKYKLEITIARCFAFVGPHLPLQAHFAIGNFIQAAVDQQPIIIKSDGTSERSYLYAADLAVWLWTLLFKGRPACTYNVGSERAVSIRELAEQVHHTLKMTEKIEIGSGGKVTSYVPDTTRAQQELGLKECFSLEESIQKHFDWIGSCSKE